MVAPLVWQAAERDGFVADVQAMRRRVVEHIPAAGGRAAAQARLRRAARRRVRRPAAAAGARPRPTSAPGADHAERARRADRAAATSAARTAQALHEAYAFLRTLEHRIQLLPAAPHPRRARGRGRRCAGSAARSGYLKDPVAELDKEWRQHRREVRRLHEKLFYRPLLAAVARIPGEDGRLTPEAAPARLAALGYADPAAALRHLEALTSGVSRTAAIQRTLLPVMLEWFADAPDPDAGLFGFRRICEALGTHAAGTSRLLRDEGEVAERLARLLATSRYATDLLAARAARACGCSASDARRRWPREALQPRRCWPPAAGRTTATTAVRAVRAVRRRELFRIAVARPARAARRRRRSAPALTDVTAATLEAALAVAGAAVAAERGGRGCRPGSRSSRWAGSAASSWATAATPTCCSCTTRCRAPTPQDAARARTAVANELRRLLAAAGHRPAARGRRRPAPRGQAGPAGAHPRRPTPPTTPSGRRSGRRRRCCGPTPSSATRTSAGGSPS